MGGAEDDDRTLDDARPVSERVPDARDGRTSVLGRYAIERLLGEGGMGVVHACRDSILERSVALKTIRGDRQARHLEARFVREACVQAQLEHPSVVPVFEVGRDELGSAYFTMRKVSGITLDEILERKRAGDPRMITNKSETFSRHRLLAAFTQICLTVHYAHARGVLHRDIKPSNIMFGDFGEVYVLDWGLAKLAPLDGSLVDTGKLPSSEKVLAAESKQKADQTAIGTALGTPAYMAPEQMLAHDVDARADVFALGAVLFEILTLVPLLDAAAVEARLRGQRARWDGRPSARAPEQAVPPEFDRICVRATAEDLEKRYASARALHDAVEAYLDGERDVELRKSLAASLFTRAEKTRTDDPDAALREVNRALALAPDDRRGLELLVDLLKESSAASTEKARAEVALAGVERQRRGQLLGAVLYAVPWLTIYPVMAALRGVTNIGVACIPPLAWACAVLALYLDHRYRTHDRMIYPTACVMLAIALSSILFGPLLLIPEVAVAAAATHVLICARRLRRATTLLAAGAIIVSMLPLWLGVWKPYDFESETLLGVHSIIKTARAMNFTIVLTCLQVFVMLGVTLFAYRFREDIERARTANSLFVWQLEKLLPPQVSADSSGDAGQASIEEASTAPLPPLKKPHSVAGLLDTEIDAKPLRAIDRSTFTRLADADDHRRDGLPDEDGAPSPDAFPLLALDGSRYVDAELVLEGKHANVLRVRDRLVGRDVAMKRMRGAATAEETAAFMRQALLQARVDHPAVPSIYDFGEDATGPWFTMKLVRGEQLSQVVKRIESAPAQGRHQRLTAFAKVCLAIDFAHEHGIVHGGLEPGNIVLGEFGEVYVLGWSQARVKADGDGAGSADIAALGEILFEIVAGKPVSSGIHIPAVLDEICAKAMAKNPSNRYRTARRLHDAIEAFLSADRDAALRATLAAERVARAEKNVERAITSGDEPARVDALRDIGRALALAPDRTPALRLLQRLLDAPPSLLPAEVTRRLYDEIWQLANRASKLTARLYLALFVGVFTIYSVFVGIRDVGMFAAIVGLWTLAAAVTYGQHHWSNRPIRFPLAATVTLFAVTSISLLFGPYMMVFGISVTITMVYVLAVQAEWRRFIIGLGLATVVVPALASWTQVLDVFRVTDPFVARAVVRFVIRGADYHPPWVFLGPLVVVHLLNVLLASYYSTSYRDMLDALETRNRARLLGLARLM